MIKLSDRLQIIADRIQPSRTMADIGTDHGLLPVYLAENGICSSVIMADISEPSLDKARQNAMKCDPEIRSIMDFRAGDGLSILDAREVDAVVIAGMGGKLIRDIMAADMEITLSVSRFVLQPRIGQGYLRKWLFDNGFDVICEDLVVEGDYIPEIITAVSPGKDCTDSALSYRYADRIINFDADADGESMVWRIPPWIVEASGPVPEFLQRNIEREKTKLKNVMMAKVRNVRLEEEICRDISYLTALAEEYEYGK